jgi:hypothetical protein
VFLEVRTTAGRAKRRDIEEREAGVNAFGAWHPSARSGKHALFAAWYDDTAFAGTGVTNLR